MLQVAVVEPAPESVASELQHMGAELHQQNDRISKVGVKTEDTHDTIRNVQRSARQDFRLRVK